MPPTLLIVDDHEAFRDYAGRTLAAEGFDIAGLAPDGEAGLLAVAELHPDVVLVDVQMPGIDGFEVADRIQAAGNGAPQVVLTSSRTAAELGARLASAPIRGFLPKDELSGAALSAILAS
jgi:DNA-binding NarL/FixJ family response regulator